RPCKGWPRWPTVPPSAAPTPWPPGSPRWASPSGATACSATAAPTCQSPRRHPTARHKCPLYRRAQRAAGLASSASALRLCCSKRSCAIHNSGTAKSRSVLQGSALAASLGASQQRLEALEQPVDIGGAIVGLHRDAYQGAAVPDGNRHLDRVLVPQTG